MKIGYSSNIAAMQALRSLATSSSAFTSALERLGSGLRINRASDDAAGLSIATRLNTDVRIYTQGIRNINDGLSLLNVAQGTLGELNSITTRLQELATQGANGVLGSSQRLSLHREAEQLVSEFNRLVGSTNFNGLNLLDGTLRNLSIQGGTSSIEFSLGNDLGRRVGTGTFGAFQQIGGSSASEVAVGDLDNDGIDDIVRADGAGNFEIFESSGHMTTVGGIDPEMDLIRLADLNNDGRLDIVFAATTTKRIWTAVHQSAGTFSLATFSLSNPTEDFEIGDFNGDGFSDLLFIDGNSTLVSLWSGNGLGAFALTSTLATGSNFRDLAIGDLDNDGDLDFGFIQDNDTLRLYRNDGNGSSFTNFQNTYINRGYSLEFQDLNGDGRLDTIMGSDDLLYIGLQDNNSSFSQFVAQPIAAGMLTAQFASTRFADLNGDGRIDILGGSNSQIVTYYGDGNGGFEAVSAIEAGHLTGESFGIGDFNNDGISDVAYGAHTLETNFAYGDSEDTSLLAYIDLRSREGALASLASLSLAQSRIASEIATLGASQSRLGTASAVLATARDNFENARSRILDADIALESANLIRLKILKDAGVAVLAQANQAPQIALLLLKN